MNRDLQELVSIPLANLGVCRERKRLGFALKVLGFPLLET